MRPVGYDRVTLAPTSRHWCWLEHENFTLNTMFHEIVNPAKVNGRFPSYSAPLILGRNNTSWDGASKFDRWMRYVSRQVRNVELLYEFRIILL